jgi:hypothetical protein
MSIAQKIMIQQAVVQNPLSDGPEIMPAFFKPAGEGEKGADRQRIEGKVRDRLKETFPGWAGAQCEKAVQAMADGLMAKLDPLGQYSKMALDEMTDAQRGALKKSALTPEKLERNMAGWFGTIAEVAKISPERAKQGLSSGLLSELVLANPSGTVVDAFRLSKGVESAMKKNDGSSQVLMSNLEDKSLAAFLKDHPACLGDIVELMEIGKGYLDVRKQSGEDAYGKSASQMIFSFIKALKEVSGSNSLDGQDYLRNRDIYLQAAREAGSANGTEGVFSAFVALKLVFTSKTDDGYADRKTNDNGFTKGEEIEFISGCGKYSGFALEVLNARAWQAEGASAPDKQKMMDALKEVIVAPGLDDNAKCNILRPLVSNDETAGIHVRSILGVGKEYAKWNSKLENEKKGYERADQHAEKDKALRADFLKVCNGEITPEAFIRKAKKY